MDDPVIHRLRAELAKLKAAGAPKEELEAEIQAAQEVIAERNAGDPERKRSTLDNIGAGAQTFSDASTLGLGGLITDAASSLGGSTFEENRKLRRENKQGFAQDHPVLSTGLEIAGSLATPIPGGAVVKAAKGAPRAIRAAAAGADAMIQGGTSGFVNSLDGTSAEDFTNAGRAGAKTAVLSGVVGAPLGALAGTATRNVQRATDMGRLDKTALEAQDALSDLSGKNYDAALAKPAVALKPEMHAVLSGPDILPIVKELRGFDQWKGVPVNDPRFLDAVYKSGLSDWGKGVEKALKDGPVDPKKANVLREQLKHIESVKSRFLDGMDKQVPGYRKAVEEHAAGEAEIAALERGADVALDVGRANPKKMKGKRFNRESKAAYLRDVPGMTQREAELGLAGMYGRVPETAKISNSLIGAFGIPASMARLPLQMLRSGDLIRALEEKTGRTFADDAMARLVRGSASRKIGAGEGR